MRPLGTLTALEAERRFGGMVRESFRPGKLPPEVMRRMLRDHEGHDPRVILGPGIGRDAAIIEFGERLLVAKTDPITFATEEIGWYAVQVNANDIATTGATPRWFLATILLPEGCTGEGLVEEIFSQIRAACLDLGVSLCGGHTEVTLGLKRPVVVGAMLGEVHRAGLVRPDGAMPGDRILLTKGIAIEGTAVLAREHPRLANLLGPDEVKRCRAFLRDPGIGVTLEARLACDTAAVHAMHDATEGGVATALHEMAEASGVGMTIQGEAIPVLPETRRVCDLLGLDPLGLLASGALLLAVSPTDRDNVVEALGRRGIAVADIGEVTPPRQGVLLFRGGEASPLPIFHQDEVARALAGL